MMRYFIVFYATTVNSYGVYPVITEGTFVNQKEVMNQIYKVGGFYVYLTNIIELSETDYKDWVK